MNFATKMKGLLSLLTLAFMAQIGVSQTVLIGGNQYAFQWTGDPDIGLYFSSSNSRYEFRDLVGAAEMWCNPVTGLSYFRNDVVVGATNNTNGRVEVASPGSNSSAVAARGTLGPTNGYLGAQGTANFDGVTTLDIVGQEVGVLGVSTGGSSGDNSGVYGHSNGNGVYGEHSVSGNNAALGTSGYSMDASGVARINGGTDVSPGSGGYLVLGAETGLNLTMDNNEIMARSNGAVSTLFFNNNGGDLSYGASGSNHTFNTSGSNSSAGPGPIQIVNGSQITALDGNEIQGYSGTTPTTFYVNFFGGNVDIASTSGGNRDVNIHGNTIDVDGTDDEVGIGEGSPQMKLHIQQAVANRAVRIDHQSNANFWSMGIGTSTQNYRFEYNGLGKGQISSVDGTYSTISDARMKRNVAPVGTVLDKVMQLKPSTYNYIDAPQDSRASIGFIAQEVEEIFPELVRTMDGNDGDEDLKVLAYTDFGILAIAAIQEMNAEMGPEKINKLEAELEVKDGEIEVLNDRLNGLETQLSEMASLLSRLDKDLSACCVSSSSDATSASAERGSLSQNIPNPFNGTTTINYYLPKDATFASLKVVDINGAIVKEFNLQGAGFGQISFASDALAGGNYFYSLFIDGEVIDTKQMNLVK